MQTSNLINLSNRSVSIADKAKQIGYHVVRGKMLRLPQDDECSSFVQSSSRSVWNHLLTSHAGSCSWLETGHLGNMPITTSPSSDLLRLHHWWLTLLVQQLIWKKTNNPACKQHSTSYWLFSTQSTCAQKTCQHINPQLFHLCSKVM